MKKHLFSVVAAVLVAWMGIAENVEAVWYSATPGLWFSSQERLNYCGVALAQGWIKGLTGSTYSQNQIAPWDVYCCAGGVNAGQMRDMMNQYAGSSAGYSRNFYYRNSSTRGSAEAALVSAVKNSRRHVALASNTVYSDGSIRTGGHWMNVWAVDVSSSVLYNVNVHDALYGSQWQSSYQSLSSSFILPKNDWWQGNVLRRGLTGRWSGIANGQWQHITY